MAEATEINIEKLKDWPCFGTHDSKDEACNLCPGARLCQEEVESKIKLREENLQKVTNSKEAEAKVKKLPMPDAKLLPFTDDEDKTVEPKIEEVEEIEFDIIEQFFPYLGDVKFITILKNLNEGLSIRTMPSLIKIFKGKQIEENRICSINVYLNEKNEIQRYLIAFKNVIKSELEVQAHEIFYKDNKTTIEINKDTSILSIETTFKGIV